MPEQLCFYIFYFREKRVSSSGACRTSLAALEGYHLREGGKGKTMGHGVGIICSPSTLLSLVIAGRKKEGLCPVEMNAISDRSGSERSYRSRVKKEREGAKQ